MDKPLISVILPVYNVEKYLSECMTSLFDQTYENLEFVMVDDGSTNKECSKMCDEFLKKDKRVVVFHKENGGLSDARNYGIKKAKGEDIFHPAPAPDAFGRTVRLSLHHPAHRHYQ